MVTVPEGEPARERGAPGGTIVPISEADPQEALVSDASFESAPCVVTRVSWK